jgi:hypothetical protein
VRETGTVYIYIYIYSLKADGTGCFAFAVGHLWFITLTDPKLTLVKCIFDKQLGGDDSFGTSARKPYCLRVERMQDLRRVFIDVLTDRGDTDGCTQLFRTRLKASRVQLRIHAWTHGA